jgi:hypothetical protein
MDDSSQSASNAQVPCNTIISELHRFIQEERVRSFDFLGQYSHEFMNQDDLLVVAPASADDIDDLRTRDLKTKQLTAYADEQWYEFNEPMGISSYLVAITVMPGGDSLKGSLIDRMTITAPLLNAMPRSSSATTWLRDTYNWVDDGRMKFSAAQYEEQRLWWNHTTQHFRLMHLPLELRESIYLQIIGPIILPDIHRSKVVLGAGLISYDKSDESKMRRDPDIDNPNMRILRVSRQLRTEATMVAYRDTFKRLRNIGSKVDSTFIPRTPISSIANALRTSSPHASFLRNIQLEMSATQYCAFISLKPKRGDPLASTNRQGALHINNIRLFAGLQRLDFRFISPKHPEASCPWSALSPHGRGIGEHSCQKVWIEWFFVLAYARLRALSSSQPIRYTLSGCVKTSTRQYWEQVLNDNRTDYKVAAKAALKKLTETAYRKGGVKEWVDGPVPCGCRMPCDKKGTMELKRFAWTEYEVRRIEGLREEVDIQYWDFVG